ncbi:MAG: signal peptide peptidase SppA [Candidatus Eisenbacteria bacterium]|uniref:Signal peptide peptidase SppA n=1 Tax=Eiseniibacteriota bacterium TaxID=2212470 RepID=A0A948RWZ4_UNCEI|nr:signal peptide peptidase SppA [Candidatus Eisenbacteria bacterium]
MKQIRISRFCGRPAVRLCLRLMVMTVLLLPLFHTPVPADHLVGEGLLARIAAVALEDDAGANLINPAGLGWSTGQDLYLILSELHRQVPSPAGTVGSPSVDDQRRRLLGAGGQYRRVGIAFERLDSGGRSRVDQWTLGFSQSMRRWLSTGYSLSRLHVGDISAWRFKVGLLARPHDAVSIGCTISDLFQSRIDPDVLHRSYRAGLGLRPLPGRLRERWTLFAEIEGDEQEKWIDDAILATGFRIEPLSGIHLSAALSNPLNEFGDDPQFHVGLAVQFSTSRIEGVYGWHADDDTTRSAGGALHLLGDRPRTLSKNPVFTSLALRGSLSDETRSGIPLPIPFVGGGRRTGVGSIMTALKNAREDSDIRGVLLKIGSVSGGSHLDEIRHQIQQIQALGKPVIAYIEEGGSHNGYGLATACDGIVLAPGSALYLLGVRSDILYLGEMMDSLGIGMSRIASGEFKTAYERYELGSASPGFREEMEALFDDHWSRWVEAVAAGRNLDPARVRELADGRVLRAEEAMIAGLVDSVGTVDLARRWLSTMAGMDDGEAPLTSTIHRRLRRTAWGPQPIVAVYYMNGFVSVGSSRRPIFGDKILGADTVRRDLKALAANKAVKAVVLRVESGGGLGLGGTLIREAVLDLKASGKPVIVSMGRVAASAAYHFSAAADYLFASPGTYTGSIGVILVRPDYAGLLNRLHIHPETIERGDRMGLWTQVRPLTDEEREMAGGWVRAEYEDFIADVAEDRAMTPDSVNSIAKGRVWTGRQALERGLIDEIGGLEDAIGAARERAGLSARAKIVPIVRPSHRSIMNLARGFLFRTVWGDQESAAEESRFWASAGLIPGTEILIDPASLFPHGMGSSILPLEYSPIGDLLLKE